MGAVHFKSVFRSYQDRFFILFLVGGICLASSVALFPGAPFFSSTASADLEHQVRKGQTLSAIARRYNISTSTLASANRIFPSGTLKIGQVLQVPEEGVVYVGKGETLSKIAKTHHVSMKELANVNDMKTTSLLQIGQRLILPGHEIAEVSQKASKKWGRAKRRGVVSLLRIAPNEKARMRLLSKGGKVRKAAIRRLRRMLRHRQTGKKRKPHPRLLRLLTRVSDHFGGREIQLISGYRPPGGHTKRTSRHTQGNAIDLRVAGVPNKQLIRYLRRFKHVGVGYYPRSTFVHMDIRDRSAYWVDWSRPGQAPIYSKPGQGPPEELVELDQQFRAKKKGAVVAEKKKESSNKETVKTPDVVEEKLVGTDKEKEDSHPEKEVENKHPAPSKPNSKVAEKQIAEKTDLPSTKETENTEPKTVAGKQVEKSEKVSEVQPSKKMHPKLDHPSKAETSLQTEDKPKEAKSEEVITQEKQS